MSESVAHVAQTEEMEPVSVGSSRPRFVPILQKENGSLSGLDRDGRVWMYWIYERAVEAAA
jgi:hypothetical protein